MNTRVLLLTILCLILMMPIVMFKVEGQTRKRPPAQGQGDRKFGLKEDNNKTAQKRIALVIGNSAYATSPLKNPVNDAQDVAKALRELGFTVDLKLNTTKEVMYRAIQGFGEKLEPNSVALFYYAGHGIQSNGENYLVPVDADVKKEAELPYTMISAGLVLAQMEGVKDSLNLVILDACRNNPFERSFRSSAKGLAQMKAPTGTLIAYSTAPGSVASDGSGRNGLYTQELLKAMRSPGLKVEEIFKEVRKSVINLSNQQQVPWDASSLVGEFYFAGGDESVHVDRNESSTAKPNSSVDVDSIDQKYWDEVDKSNIAELKAYIDKFPYGLYNDLATTKIMKLEAANKGVEEERYWGSVDKTRVEELKGYLEKYPNGTYSDLAKAKVTNLEAVSSSTGSGAADPAVDKRMTGEFVAIPAGEFEMGGSNKHRVTISKAFGMGKYEVTQGQWASVMGSNPSKFKGDENLPVERVSWEDVQEFISKLNSRSSKYTYRLPTEAEWEYACRAGTTGDYAGNLDSMGWYASNSGDKTHAVGQKQPNAWGLYDMHGNVWEWCSDWYGDYPSGTVTDPSGASSGSLRVHRGGSCYSSAEFCRSALRNGHAPDYRYGNVGFRLVRTLR